MLLFLLRALLVIFALRLVFWLARLGRLAAGRARGGLDESGVGGEGVGRGRDPGLSGPGGSGPEGELSIDRSLVIDVPFSEEDRQAKREAPPGSDAPGDGPGAR